MIGSSDGDGDDVQHLGKFFYFCEIMLLLANEGGRLFPYPLYAISCCGSNVLF